MSGMIIQPVRSQNQRMQNFAFWYTYYDSIFLKESPSLPYTFFHEVKLCSVLKKPWLNYSSLPELPHLLADLEAFLISKNWKKCQLEETEAKTIQNQLNNLMTLVEVQKIYTEQFWRTNKRRIEASFIHYFIFLKRLVVSLIPVTCPNLSKTIQSKKCCLEMKQIEKLINHFLNHLPKIYNFFSNTFFDQEEALITELFQQITQFCRNLPKLTKKQLEQIPKIVRYICLNNSLESLNNDKIDNIQPPLRRRATNQSSQAKQTKRNRDSLAVDNLSASSNGRKSQKSNIENNKSEIFPWKSVTLQDSKQGPKLFKFHKQIFKETQFNNLRMTAAPRSGKIQRKDSHPQGKQFDRLRSNTIISFANKRKGSFKLDSPDKRDTVHTTDRDRLFTRTTSFDINDRYKNSIDWLEEQQEQRKHLTVKPKTTKLLNYYSISTKANLENGKLKGWAILRQYVFKRIAQRKLKKLMFC